MPNLATVAKAPVVRGRAAARPGPRPGFTRDEIVECALRLMEREGHEALSFRAVARELGIAAGALSRYFANLADLEDAVAAEVVSAIKPLRAGPRRELRERLADFGMEIFHVTRAHPYLAEIHGPVSAAAVAATMRQSLESMLDAGIDLQRGLLLYSVVANLGQSWGMRDATTRSPAQNAAITAAIAVELGKLVPQLKKFAPKSLFGAQRIWFLTIVDGMLK